MIEIRGIKILVEENIGRLEEQIMKRLHLKTLPDYQILKRSIDARKKPKIFYVYQVGVFLENESQVLSKINDNNIMLTKEVSYQFSQTGEIKMEHHPLIIGAGPAGLFCGLLLAKMGYAPVIVERGSSVDVRVHKVNHFWETGELDTECNVQFGEGGAGTFSDGKLNTQVKDKYGRIRYVLETFVRNGANPEILYDYKPHMGTDCLTHVVRKLREEIKAYGGVFLFDTRAADLRIENGRVTGVWLVNREYETWVDSNHVILAIGHSARDTFDMLYRHDIDMQAKDFAMGVRVEHPARLIQNVSYGDGRAGEILPAAPYKLTHQAADGRGVYSFCMCPGGYVVNASSEQGRVAVNGMSYSSRDGVNSNSAIVVMVNKEDFPSDHPLAGVTFQRALEENIYREGNGKVVVQRFEDFKENRSTETLGKIIPQIKGGYVLGNLSTCLPDYMVRDICEAMEAFDGKIAGFADGDTVLSGVESRTSSPVRIVRDEEYLTNIRGIYPCGEGAGYAGGIMSAAMDGLKVAEAIIKVYAPKDSKLG